MRIGFMAKGGSLNKSAAIALATGVCLSVKAEHAMGAVWLGHIKKRKNNKT